MGNEAPPLTDLLISSMAIRLVLSLKTTVAYESAYPINQEPRTAPVYWTPAPLWNEVKAEMRRVTNQGLTIAHATLLHPRYGVSHQLVDELIEKRLLAYCGHLGGLKQWRLTELAHAGAARLGMVGFAIFQRDLNDSKMVVPSIETEAIQLEDKASDPGDALFDPRE